jgi:mannose-6-phosphate isomerase-like protein (cupin superfamily)
VLAPGEIADLSMGLVSLEGPVHKTPGTHEEWDQVYLIFSGRATIHLGDRKVRVTEPSAVIIPRGTKHSVEVAAGEKIRYVYVNKW